MFSGFESLTPVRLNKMARREKKEEKENLEDSIEAK